MLSPDGGKLFTDRNKLQVAQVQSEGCSFIGSPLDFLLLNNRCRNPFPGIPLRLLRNRSTHWVQVQYIGCFPDKRI